ncbi:glycosyltransferase family 4 protein [Limobrevibacterium gyesilva]|uniref:Glycosyltransferase family 4 protein n=1 Tax=Limobrevibacterium gyesilva TaxID=2991712 RepID=A0AA42CE60_9PROT|nr:glycosyltransferase family 4 protein [Limobrevibacterium gyesilva]MCW3474859.1 glycosyltransferase family 4 protein [Limobrevibacterium gyesilva]
MSESPADVHPPGPYPVVLQVLPALGGGGVERGTVEMASAIAIAGGRPLVASAGGRLAASVERAGGRNVVLPLDSKNPWRIWRNAALLEALIRRERVDIVHARSRAPAWSAWLAARRAGVHFVTTYHAPYGEGFPLKRRYNAVMAKGERVIAISHFIAGVIQARHGVDPGRIRVIHRGVDPAMFDPQTVGSERILRLARSWRVPDGQPTVVLPGRLTRWKGQAVLIEALARMANRDVCAVLVGADQGRHRYAAELVALAERLGVGARVRLVGHCDDMPAAMMLSDVVVNASTEPEGFGRVVIEAQAMARPVVGTDHGGAVETIEHGVTGWRAAPGDPAALAVVLDQALAMPAAERAALGRRARAAVQAHYTVQAMQAATIDVYREVLG